jgi:hypothetical protein
LALVSSEYYINPTAVSRLGSLHTKETIVLMSKAKTGDNHPMFGRTHSAETIVKMSEAHLGKIHSEETKAKLSETHRGKIHSEETKALISEALTGINNPMFGKSHSKETKAKMSKRVFVYSSYTPTILEHEFVSYSEAAKHFNCSIMTISRYINSGKLLQKQWILYSSKSE